MSDIDHTLRKTTLGSLIPFSRQERICGARRLVASVAARGTPIVYLTAAPAALFRAKNQRFLRHFPRGILIDRPGLGLRDLNPYGQVRSQGRFKARVLARLRRCYPSARLVCIGDDRFSDAAAYAGRCHASFVRRAVRGSKNIPRGFSGHCFRIYNWDLRRRVMERIPGPHRLPPGMAVHIPGARGVAVGR